MFRGGLSQERKATMSSELLEVSPFVSGESSSAVLAIEATALHARAGHGFAFTANQGGEDAVPHELDPGLVNSVSDEAQRPERRAARLRAMARPAKPPKMKKTAPGEKNRIGPIHIAPGGG